MNTLAILRGFNAVAGRLLPQTSAGLARKLLMTPRRLAPRDWERPALDSAERITFRFGLSGLRWGPRDAPVILMLHGWEGRGSQFRYLVEPLVAAGRQVIALDAPAHGASPGEEANPVLFAQAALEAAAEIRDLEAVVGHSMGAAALAYALSQGLPAERAVLISGPSRLSDVLKAFADYIGLPARSHPAFFARVERHTGVPIAHLDIVRAAARLQLPVLAVHDRSDVEVPFRASQQLVQALPQAELFATEGLGHVRVLKDAAVIRRVTRFLLGAQPALLPKAA